MSTSIEFEANLKRIESLRGGIESEEAIRRARSAYDLANSAVYALIRYVIDVSPEPLMGRIDPESFLARQAGDKYTFTRVLYFAIDDVDDRGAAKERVIKMEIEQKVGNGSQEIEFATVKLIFSKEVKPVTATHMIEAIEDDRTFMTLHPEKKSLALTEYFLMLLSKAKPTQVRVPGLRRSRGR